MATLNLTTKTTLAYAIPEFWDVKVRLDAVRKAFWSKFEGKEGDSKPIIIRNDFTNGPGDLIHIQTMSQLEGDGVTAESTLEGNEEQLALGQFDLSVDWLRHAVAFTKKAKKEANFNAVTAAGRMLSTWFARYSDADMFAQLLDNVTDVLYANDATTDATIDSADTFGTTEIDRIRLALLRKGAIPIQVIKKGQEEFPVFGIVISEMDAYNLIADGVWVRAQERAAMSGENNPLFTMALGMYHGCLIYVHNGIAKFQGTPIRPEASVYGAHSDSVTTITVGANTNKNYTRFFPDTGYIKIVRASDGNQEFCQYTSKTNNTFVLTGGGGRGASYGSEGTADGAVAYVTGDLITAYNHRSVCMGFGAEIAVRSWGQHPKPITEVKDYGFENGIGIEAIYGQKAIENKDGDKPNFATLHTFARNPSRSI